MVLTNLVTMYIWSFCPTKAMGAENRMEKKGQLLLFIDLINFIKKAVTCPICTFLLYFKDNNFYRGLKK